jgi:hypothetical protein
MSPIIQFMCMRLKHGNKGVVYQPLA